MQKSIAYEENKKMINMLKQYTCEQCGKTFKKSRHKTRKRTFCSSECYHEYRRIHAMDVYGAKYKWGKQIHDPPIEYRKCYMKEARAMLQGKNWKGKNKCVELPEE